MCKLPVWYDSPILLRNGHTLYKRINPAREISTYFCAEKSLCGDYEVEPGEACDGGLEGMFGLVDCCDSNCQLRAQANCRYIYTFIQCHVLVVVVW